MKRSSDKPVKAARGESPAAADVLELFHPVTAQWFRAVFEGATAPQSEGWPAIARGESTLILAPTGTGKTLTAFLWCLDRLMLWGEREKTGCKGGVPLTAEGAGCGCGAEPAVAAGRG